MPAPVRWPCSWAPVSLDLRLVNLAVSGGRALSGGHRVRLTGAPYWRGSYTFNLSGSAKIVTARAVAAMMQGPVNSIVLPAFDCGRSPAGYANGWKLPSATVPHSDGALFSDGTGYASGIYSARASAPAVEHGTTLAITWATPFPAPMPGQVFSVADRLHLIHSVMETSATGATLGFDPPLRAAVDAGADVNFDCPVGTFRLAGDQPSGTGALDRLRWGAFTLEVEEPL